VRFAEIALLVSPFVVFVAWRLSAPTAGPPRVLVVAVTVTVVAMAGLLVGLWYEEAEPPGTGYVAARLQDGRILPGRAVPGAPPPVASAAPAQRAPITPPQVGPIAPGPITTGQAGPASPGLAGPSGPGQVASPAIGQPSSAGPAQK
jgi:hypothetical protein